MEPSERTALPTTPDAAPLSPGKNGTGDPPIPVHATSTAPMVAASRLGYFERSLEDAERLLRYVAEAGIDIDEGVRRCVLHARTTIGSGALDEDTAAGLLAALTRLAARIKPVTAASLEACYHETRPTVRAYWIVAILLAVVIVPFSVFSFVTSAISEAIRKDIVTANDLAVKLRAELGAVPADGEGAAPPSPLPPGLNVRDVVKELQQYASTIRAIDLRARQLNFFVLYMEKDPFGQIRHSPVEIRKTFELPPGLADFGVAADQRTAVYQEVRYFAQSLIDDVSVVYGAIATCVLPALYALLGTCAYLLRSFEQQVRDRTFFPSSANSARFLIAAIGGAVVGLFNNFSITQGASIPPLAIAFLVGYAVDVFFSFLEGLIQAFTRNRTDASVSTVASAAHAPSAPTVSAPPSLSAASSGAASPR